MLIVVYMCDRATKYGIGGKVSVFMVNIVSGMMTMFKENHLRGWHCLWL